MPDYNSKDSLDPHISFLYTSVGKKHQYPSYSSSPEQYLRDSMSTMSSSSLEVCTETRDEEDYEELNISSLRNHSDDRESVHSSNAGSKDGGKKNRKSRLSATRHGIATSLKKMRMNFRGSKRSDKEPLIIDANTNNMIDWTTINC